MVSGTIFQSLLLAQQVSRKVPEPTRTIILMALLGILLVGLLLIVGTLLGGHWVRRQGRSRRGPAVPADVILPRPPQQQHNSAKQTDHTSTSDTFVSDDTVGTDDTIVS